MILPSSRGDKTEKDIYDAVPYRWKVSSCNSDLLWLVFVVEQSLINEHINAEQERVATQGILTCSTTCLAKVMRMIITSRTAVQWC